MSEIRLPRVIVNRILAHGQENGAAEVCGLISSREGTPYAVYPVLNTARDPARRFAMDPQAQIDALRRMREAGEELFAIYHSHPQGPALPSAADLAEAAYPEALYLIVSLGTEGVLELQGFRVREGRAVPVTLVLS